MLLGIVQNIVVEVVLLQVHLANITLMKHCLRLALSAPACGAVKTADVLLYVALLASMARIASQEEISGVAGLVGDLAIWESTRCLRLSAS